MSQFWSKWLKREQAELEGRMSGELPPSSDTDKPVRWGMRVLLVGLALFFLWGAFAPLGRGVPASGYVVVDGSRKTIQHSKGGIVEELLVREGDMVQANQPLIKLNPTQMQSQQGSIEGQLYSMLALQTRLDAERLGAARLKFPEFLMAKAKLPQVQEVMQVQEQLFKTRMSTLQGELAIMTETLNGLERQQEGLTAREKSNDTQHRMYTEEWTAIKPMYDQGFVPRQRLFDLERSMVYLEGQRSENRSDLARVKSQMGEVRLKMIQVRQAYRKEVETQWGDVQKEISTLKERYVATQDDLARVIIRAPEAGSVVEMALHTVGGVVAPGQKLMDLVPMGTKLVVEVMVPTHLVDTVVPGQAVDIHFSALDQTIVPVVEGKLIYLSADRQTEPRTDVSFFTARIEMTVQGLQQLKGQVIRAGMPADVVIKTGERTFFGYMLKPLLTRLQSAMTER